MQFLTERIGRLLQEIIRQNQRYDLVRLNMAALSTDSVLRSQLFS
jgi:hypothetical protein